MRRLSLFVVMAACCQLDIALADGRAFTISTGYNETALTSGFNRSTSFQTQIGMGRKLYLGTIDSRGFVSLGVGQIASGEDFYCRTIRSPMITVFGRHGEGSGVALELLQDWYFRGSPTRSPAKFLTLFQSKGGIVWQNGELPRVRVAHRFISSQRRLPSRSQGLEWVWEFRSDDPAVFTHVGDQGAMASLSRRSMRQEHWVFFTRELGVGVVRLNVGATQKNVFRPLPNGDQSIQPSVRKPMEGWTRVPMLMVRVAYDIRRW